MSEQHVPGPQQEVIRSLQERVAAMRALLGELTVHVQAAESELLRLGAPLAEPATLAAPKNDAQLFTPYSRLEDIAERSQEQLEQISAGNLDFPEQVQQIFAPTCRYFVSNLGEHIDPANDRCPNGYSKPSRRKLTRVPEYSDTKAWQNMLKSRRIQSHYWQERAADNTFQCSYSVDYAMLRSKAPQLVRYGFSRTVLGDNPLISYEDSNYGTVSGKITVAKEEVTEACFTLCTPEAAPAEAYKRLRYEYAFQNPRVIQGEKIGSPYNKETTQTFTYSHADNEFHGSRTLSVEDVLGQITTFIGLMPSRR